MTPGQLNARLLTKVEAVCRLLLPQGKVVGAEWQCGDISGQPGRSLQVHLSGDKAGVWADFAGGECGGDLIDLWQAARRLSLSEALTEIRAWLGVVEDGASSRPQRQYARPDRPVGFRPIQQFPDALEQLTDRGLTVATLTAAKLAANDREIAFPYLREGQLINIKYLGLERQDGKKRMRQEKNAEPTLYGWHLLDPQAREVILVEGEVDALSLYQLGFPALSLPNGANPGHGLDWIEADYEALQRFDTLYLGPDMDAPGRAILPEMVRRLGVDRCRIVDWPAKDPNEALQSGLTVEQVKTALLRARSQDPKELQSSSAFIEAVTAEFYPDPQRPVGVTLPFRTPGAPLVFRPGELTIWSGWSGSGKSNLLGYLALTTIQSQAARWCVASMEMSPPRTLARMIRQSTAQAKPDPEAIATTLQTLGPSLWLFTVTGVAVTKRLLEVFRYAARRYGINQFVVDSLAKLDVAEDDYTGQKNAINALVAFAHDYQAHVHLVAHPRKSDRAGEDRPPNKQDVRGGASLTDLADNVVVLWRNRRQDRSEADPNGLLLVEKCRHEDGEEGAINLWFDANSLRYRDRRT